MKTSKKLNIWENQFEAKRKEEKFTFFVGMKRIFFSDSLDLSHQSAAWEDGRIGVDPFRRQSEHQLLFFFAFTEKPAFF